MQEGLALLRTCPMCRHQFDDTAVRVIEERSAMRLMHMSCGECQTAILAMVMASDLGMSTVGVLTDLSANDAERILGTDVFSEDDVLAFYSFIEQQGACRDLAQSKHIHILDRK